jgi:hypothetical protein
MATAYIDNTPAENSGVGPKFTFRERDREKEIQQQAFSTFSPSKVNTFAEIKVTK